MGWLSFTQATSVSQDGRQLWYQVIRYANLISPDQGHFHGEHRPSTLLALALHGKLLTSLLGTSVCVCVPPWSKW